MKFLEVYRQPNRMSEVASERQNVVADIKGVVNALSKWLKASNNVLEKVLLDIQVG